MRKILVSLLISTALISAGCEKHKHESDNKPIANYQVKNKSGDDPASVYMSGLGYFANRDPQSQEPTIQEFVIANFNSHNRVQWENTDSHDLFTLIRIDNPVYDGGVIVGGDLIWGKQQFSMPMRLYK